MADYLLKGILIGLLFGLPVGAVGAMTVERTLRLGLKAGLLTGLGSSVADCLYAVIGAFGITLVSDFLLRHQASIHLLGGCLLLFLGIRLFLRQVQPASLETSMAEGVTLFASSFVIGITNPAAILTFLFAFSYFEVTGVAAFSEGAALVSGVFFGTYFWWSAISFATYALKQKVDFHHFRYSNKVFGGILAVFGASILVNSFFH